MCGGSEQLSTLDRCLLVTGFHTAVSSEGSQTWSADWTVNEENEAGVMSYLESWTDLVQSSVLYFAILLDPHFCH